MTDTVHCCRAVFTADAVRHLGNDFGPSLRGQIGIVNEYSFRTVNYRRREVGGEVFRELTSREVFLVVDKLTTLGNDQSFPFAQSAPLLEEDAEIRSFFARVPGAAPLFPLRVGLGSDEVQLHYLEDEEEGEGEEDEEEEEEEDEAMDIDVDRTSVAAKPVPVDTALNAALRQSKVDDEETDDDDDNLYHSQESLQWQSSPARTPSTSSSRTSSSGNVKEQTARVDEEKEKAQGDGVIKVAKEMEQQRQTQQRKGKQQQKEEKQMRRQLQQQQQPQTFPPGTQILMSGRGRRRSVKESVRDYLFEVRSRVYGKHAVYRDF